MSGYQISSELWQTLKMDSKFTWTHLQFMSCPSLNLAACARLSSRLCSALLPAYPRSRDLHRQPCLSVHASDRRSWRCLFWRGASARPCPVLFAQSDCRTGPLLPHIDSQPPPTSTHRPPATTTTSHHQPPPQHTGQQLSHCPLSLSAVTVRCHCPLSLPAVTVRCYCPSATSPPYTVTVWLSLSAVIALLTSVIAMTHPTNAFTRYVNPVLKALRAHMPCQINNQHRSSKRANCWTGLPVTSGSSFVPSLRPLRFISAALSFDNAHVAFGLKPHRIH